MISFEAFRKAGSSARTTALGKPTTWHRKHLLVALAYLAMALPVAPGCRTGSPSASHRQTEKAGFFAVSVVEVKRCPTRSEDDDESGWYELGVLLDVTSLSDERVPANFYYAKIIDANERVWRPHFGDCRPYLARSPLKRDMRARGWVNYRLPSDAAGLKLSYAPHVEGNELAHTWIDLKL